MEKHLKIVESKGNRLLGLLSKSSIKEIRDVGLLKYVFNARVRSALHYGAELWGFNKGLNLERMRLRFSKRMALIISLVG